MSQNVFDEKAPNLSKKTKAKRPWYRTAIQIFFFVLVILITINQLLEKSGMSIPLVASASLHAICPFGGIVSIYKFITVGTFVQKIHESSFVLMIISIVLAIGFGPVICGWVCPLGTFQEWIGKIGKRIFGEKYNHFIPSRFDKYLRFTRYLLLIMVVFKTATMAKLMFVDIDPYFALFNFWSDEVAIGSLIILGITIILSLFIERPWCKYACPYGALLGISNLFRVFKIRRNQSTCINCTACDKSCPMNIPVSKQTIILDHQCISCMKCTSETSCPVSDTVAFSMKGGKY